jgi:hypothetical protein
MISVSVYLFNCFFYRLGEFFRHWYGDGFFFFFHRLIDFLEQLDRYFALKINFYHLFKPLYRQYTFIGYVLGFIFRGVRIIVAGFIYGIVILTGLILYLAWAFIPIFILLKILI